MADKNPFAQFLTIDGLKTMATIASVLVTIFGVVKFGIGKIDEYDGYASRIEKLEARDSAVTALTESGRTVAFQMTITKSDIDAIKLRLDNAAADILNIRLSQERIRALMEKTGR